jgi:glycosyltransferase involved in cell wall biosynthesis
MKKMMIVLSMITYNSYTKMKGTVSLEKVLDSTLQIPYRQMILIDDSSDETLGVIKAWCGQHEKELLNSRSRLYGYYRHTRATARQTAIDIFFENFDNEWIMFVDDDVILRDGWWNWMLANEVLEDKVVGEIWGINWDASPEREKFLAMFGVNLKSYLIRKFYERGGTHDTLYRRKAIEGIKIPPELHIYEDAYLHFYVACSGYKSIVNPVGVTHYHPAYTLTDLKREKEKARLAIEASLKYGICEYEDAKTLKKYSKGLKAYLALFRPIIGLPPMLLTTVRVYGVKTGVVEGFKRQYFKLWFRWQVLRNVGKVGRIPDVCEAIRRERS